jgi:predicted transposase YdaD
LEGKLEGKQEGKQEGRQEGRLEEASRIVRRLLMLRFGALPDWADDRLRQANTTDLELWADRILDVPAIEAVFRD